MASNPTLRPFGLRDMKVFEITATVPTYAAGVDIPCVNSAQFDPVVTEAVLEGDDVKCSTHAILENITVTVTHGGMPMSLYDVIMGASLVDSGSGSAEVVYLNLKTSSVRPYFGMILDSRADEGGNTLVIFYKCKMVGGGGGTFQKGSFFAPQFNVNALPSDYDSDTIMRAGHYETITAISTTWLTNNVHI
jgi:hypothetical protein